MLAIPGFTGRDTCDGVSRRDLLRIGGSGVLGISLASLFALKDAQALERQAYALDDSDDPVADEGRGEDIKTEHGQDGAATPVGYHSGKMRQSR